MYIYIHVCICTFIFYMYTYIERNHIWARCSGGLRPDASMRHRGLILCQSAYRPFEKPPQKKAFEREDNYNSKAVNLWKSGKNGVQFRKKVHLCAMA